MAENLFVYGTLHPDRAPAEIVHLVQSFHSIGEGTVRARKHQFEGFPAIKIDSKNGTRVAGHVFRVPNSKTLEELDKYEEYDPKSIETSLFQRRQVKVRLADGSAISCWIYEYNRDLPRSVRSRRSSHQTSKQRIA